MPAPFATPPPLDALSPALAAEARRALAAFDVPGAVVAVVRGDEDYLLSWGVAETGTARSVGPDTVFDVGSCSKSHVATAIAVLATQKKLKLDDPVRRYVPELELDDAWVSEQVQICDLLSNRTGLARQRPIEAFANHELSVEAILPRLKHIPRIRPFRAGYVYFNIGFVLCALIVERVTGMTYAEFLAREVFAPLGMQHSGSGQWALDRLPEIAAGHTLNGGALKAVAPAAYENTQGAGGVFSTGRDALRWLRFHAREDEQGKIVSPALLRLLHRPHTVMPQEETRFIHRAPGASLAAYCLGWWTSEFGGHRLVHHSGEMFGWRAHTALLPTRELGVAVYLNAARNVHAAICYMAMEHLLGAPPRDWTAIAQAQQALHVEQTERLTATLMPADAATPMSLPLSAYEGRFFHPAAGAVEVTSAPEMLRMRQMDGRLWDMDLTPIGGDVFSASFSLPEVADYQAAPSRVRFVVGAGVVVALQDMTTLYVRQKD